MWPHPPERVRAHLRLYLVTDADLCLHHTMSEVIRLSVAGGATCVQLREKGLGTRAFVERARALKALLSTLAEPVPLIINDRLDVALACGADGVHVGQSDMPVEVVRAHLPRAIVGLSVESVEDARASAGLDVDYLGVSPVFATPTKTDTAPALGLSGLAAIRALGDTPLVGIGGLNAANAAEVIRAGADGIAVVSALCAAEDPEAAARDLRARVDAALSTRRAEVRP
jgi:thiamine-phosphate pyrophosphorylase